MGVTILGHTSCPFPSFPNMYEFLKYIWIKLKCHSDRFCELIYNLRKKQQLTCTLFLLFFFFGGGGGTIISSSYVKLSKESSKKNCLAPCCLHFSDFPSLCHHSWGHNGLFVITFLTISIVLRHFLPTCTKYIRFLCWKIAWQHA